MEGEEHLSIELDSLDKLFNAYMPFIKQSALFVPTHRDFQMGDSIMLDLSLLDEPRTYKVHTKVVWITPKGAQRGKASGIGLQFVNDVEGLCKKIETHLAGKLTSSHPTDTM